MADAKAERQSRGVDGGIMIHTDSRSPSPHAAIKKKRRTINHNHVEQSSDLDGSLVDVFVELSSSEAGSRIQTNNNSPRTEKK